MRSLIVLLLLVNFTLGCVLSCEYECEGDWNGSFYFYQEGFFGTHDVANVHSTEFPNDVCKVEPNCEDRNMTFLIDANKNNCHDLPLEWQISRYYGHFTAVKGQTICNKISANICTWQGSCICVPIKHQVSSGSRLCFFC